MTLSNHADVWSHLRNDTTFKTYADERLAMLYLQNADSFPIDMLSKVFDVILDPLFKIEDITFKSVWDIFAYISDYRRRGLRTNAHDEQPGAGVVVPETRIRSVPPLVVNLVADRMMEDQIPMAGLAANINETALIAPHETLSYSVPPLAVSLVVDRMIEDRVPMGSLTEYCWGLADKWDVEDFREMSLVHSTWTPIARRALQRRVLVPYSQINNFLLSPLCGPWVTEMAIYWTINNGFEGATSSDVDLFQALLERTPQIQSLAFVTVLDGNVQDGDFFWCVRQRGVHHASSLQFSRCLELITDMAPNLENLWLKHQDWKAWMRSYRSSIYFDDEISRSEEYDLIVGLTADLRTCDDVDSLSRLLSNLRSLKFFSMHSWNTVEQVHIERHPRLQTVEVHNNAETRHGRLMKSLYWSRAPGGELIKASGLSCKTTVPKHLPVSELSGLAKLQLEGGCVSDLAEDLHHCTSLVHLELSELNSLRGTYDRSAIMDLFPSHTFDSQIIREFCDSIRSLPCLRRLVLSVSYYYLPLFELQDLIKSFNQSESAPPGEQEGRTTPLIELCKERGVEFVLKRAGKDDHYGFPTAPVTIRVC